MVDGIKAMTELTPEQEPWVAAWQTILKFGPDAEAMADQIIKVAEVDEDAESIELWTAIRRCIDELRKDPGKLDEIIGPAGEEASG